MNKWQIICPVIALAIIGLFVALQHGSNHRKILRTAIEQQLDAQSTNIAHTLTTMSTNEPSAIADAIYLELQGSPSTSLLTSLLTRADIQVSRSTNGLECLIDTTRWGLTPRSIRQVLPPATTP